MYLGILLRLSLAWGIMMTRQWIGILVNMVSVYTKQLTTYAIGYTVYCRVETEVSLGSYTGTVTATLQDAEGETIAKQENMPQNQIIFSSVPRGKYEVVVEWEDGTNHSMRIPVEVK